MANLLLQDKPVVAITAAVAGINVRRLHGTFSGYGGMRVTGQGLAAASLSNG